ncbi:MAG: DUF6544 family protein [Polyangiaceae bacterium]
MTRSLALPPPPAPPAPPLRKPIEAHDALMREVARAGLPGRPPALTPVTQGDIDALCAPVQRYLRFMGVLGKRPTWSLRAHFMGSFRLRPEARWLPCHALQYNSAASVARIFQMRLRYHHLPLLVRDTYLHGRGRMSARLFDTFPFVDESDERIATGELVTYLNDAVLLAPSMLLLLSTSFSEVDRDTFDVTLRDSGREVTARVFLDGRGGVTDFSTTDRFGNDPARTGKMVRARWSTPVRAWRWIGDLPVPASAVATWHFDSGDFNYADFALVSLEHDVPPGTIG